MKFNNKKYFNRIGLLIIKTMVIHVILYGLFLSDIFAQERQNPNVYKGVQLFWNAQFEEAIDVLRETIAYEKLSKDELFSAYLYLGFSFIRSNTQPGLVDQIFRQAVKANPQLKLDPFKIPPDLLTRFEKVRNNLVRSFYITSQPSEAEVLVYGVDKKILFRGATPQQLTEILSGTYEIRMKKKNYHDEIFQVDFSATTADTLNVILKLKDVPLHKKWWTWAAGGGVVLATIAALIIENEAISKQPASSDLPMPPARP